MLARIGPDAESASFDVAGSWKIEATTSSYCAVTVIDAGTGEVHSGLWGGRSFTLEIDEGGQFSMATSGCDEAVARAG